MNPKLDRFLENHNMNYLYLLLSNMEVSRLNNLPASAKNRFGKKLTEVAMEHVAANEIPDYTVEEEFDEEQE
ncbi:MAG: hypothetical protein CSB55_00720 [Candidatus Cloacimonadota bacterium]|nr:MAG: hypothetical protein CSB55_00720 [Candidatus Cloacimonadota bacterium]